MHLANETLKFLTKNKKKVFKNLESKSSKFSNKLNENIKKHKLNAKVIRFKSVIRIIFTDKDPKDRVQRDFFEKKNNLKRTKFIKYLRKKYNFSIKWNNFF